MRSHHVRRLLILLPSLRNGGTERHTAELAARLVGAGLSVTLAAEPSLHGALRREPRRGAELREASIGWDEADPAASWVRQAAETARLIAELRPDAAILPLPWPDAGLGAMRALAEAGTPRLVLFHLAAEGPPPQAVAAAQPSLGVGASVLAAVSAPVARRVARLFGLPEARVAVVPNPAPSVAAMERDAARAALRGAMGLRGGAPLLLFVGRLEEAKGADLLPEISARLPMTLACIGDGPMRGLLEARAAGDPRRLLRVLGPIADPGPWYLAADALILPSRLEGAPLVFLEAAAHRLPVVATEAALEALGGLARRVARIAGPEPGSLAEAAGTVVADPQAAWTAVEAAAAHAARLDWEGTAARILGLLRVAPMLVEAEAV